MKIFYVCSYGGCGSTMLCKYLNNYGKSFHVHDRYPPDKLSQLGLLCYHEWFNGVEIPNHELNQYYVIFIYREPIHCIYSRFHIPEHLYHIKCNTTIKLHDVITEKKDLYGINFFFNKYTTPNPKRNYKIHCIKYEELFENMSTFNKYFDLRDDNILYPVESVSNYVYKEKDILTKIYTPLINKMNKMNFIECV